MGSFVAMTNPATKPTRSKPTAKSTKSTTKTTAKPAAKSTTKTTSAKPAAKSTKSAAKPAAVETTTTTTPKFVETPEAAELLVLFDARNAAVAAFETFVCEQITSGVSPTHIGKTIGLGNSAVRRIAMRNGLAVK